MSEPQKYSKQELISTRQRLIELRDAIAFLQLLVEREQTRMEREEHYSAIVKANRLANNEVFEGAEEKPDTQDDRTLLEEIHELYPDIDGEFAWMRIAARLRNERDRLCGRIERLRHRFIIDGSYWASPAVHDDLAAIVAARLDGEKEER